jgi:hypothetical protein
MDVLMGLCEAEFRFYKNSLRNFRPGNIGAGTGVDDLVELLPDADTAPKQSMALGLPAMCIDHATAHFDFPTNFDDVMGVAASWTIEYLGVVQDRVLLAPATYFALLGEGAAASPYIGLTNDNLVDINLGVQRISTDSTDWWKDGLLHFVVAKEAGAGADFHAYVNGVEPTFASQVAGDEAFTDAAGTIFNHSDAGGDNHPFWGHHFLLRQYSDALEKYEVLELFQDAQRLVPEHLMQIPID